MSEKGIEDRIFLCGVEACTKDVFESKDWKNCPKRILCRVCELENIQKGGMRKVPAIGKFQGMNLQEKKEVLKKRSQVDNRKNENTERRKWMYDNNIGIGGRGD